MRDSRVSWRNAHKPKAIAKLVELLSQVLNGEVQQFYYEASYVLYRQLLALGQTCQVVASSLMPKKPGETGQIESSWQNASGNC